VLLSLLWTLRGIARSRVALHLEVLALRHRRIPSCIAIYYGYNWHMKVSVAEAKNTLPKLIKAVEDGESVTTYRHGTPVVDIVRTTKAHAEKPKFGTL